jgi:hypothetical protein
MRNHISQPDTNLTKAFLESAITLLAQADGSDSHTLRDALVAAERFMANTQFELALDVLAEAGRTTSPRAKFWDSLSKAAKEMGLREKAQEFSFLWAEAASASLQRQIGRK